MIRIESIFLRGRSEGKTTELRMMRIETEAGTSLENTCRDLVLAADRARLSVETEFNGILIAANPGETWQFVRDQWVVKSNVRERAIEEARRYDAELFETLKGVLAELVEQVREEGISVNTLRLWSMGKMIGGPKISVFAFTPMTCAAIADAMEREIKEDLRRMANSRVNE